MPLLLRGSFERKSRELDAIGADGRSHRRSVYFSPVTFARSAIVNQEGRRAGKTGGRALLERAKDEIVA